MQSERNIRTKISWKSILLLVVISFSSCVIGSMLGACGFWYYEQLSTDVFSIKQPESPIPLANSNSSPAGDGFFIVNNGNFIKIPENFDDSQIDFSVLPSTNNRKTTFAVRGANFPLGSLTLSGYIAGIGVDANFTQTGAVINSVFEDSPARIANLQPGDVIVSIDGERVKSPTIYQPGKKDLFGAMQEKVSLVIMSGTNNRIIEIPRTYLGTIDYGILSVTNQPITFSIQPVKDYVLLKVDQELKPGVYRFYFQNQNVIDGGGALTFEPTPTPTLPPIPLPTQKWMFVVK